MAHTLLLSGALTLLLSVVPSADAVPVTPVGQAAEVAPRADAAGAAEIAPVADASPRLASAVRVPTPAGVVLLPAGFGATNGAYDVVVHFHGAAESVEPAFAASGLRAAMIDVNLGNGSGPYEDRYARPGALDDVLGVVVRVARQHGIEGNVGRIALSSWSAGYGGVTRLLFQPGVAERVDTILLADGLHAGFAPLGYRKIQEVLLAPFVRFAERAARGEAMFAITHSSIHTPSYASTTETARYLAAAVGAERTETHAVGPRGMKELYRASRGGFVATGYEGTTPEAHCDHLRAIGKTLWPELAARWAGGARTDHP